MTNTKKRTNACILRISDTIDIKVDSNKKVKKEEYDSNNENALITKKINYTGIHDQEIIKLRRRENLYLAKQLKLKRIFI